VKVGKAPHHSTPTPGLFVGVVKVQKFQRFEFFLKFCFGGFFVFGSFEQTQRAVVCVPTSGVRRAGSVWLEGYTLRLLSTERPQLHLACHRLRRGSRYSLRVWWWWWC
jgi:hypothetical protein